MSEPMPFTWKEIRAERDELLKQTDALMVPDRPLTEKQKSDILAYRKALRELPGIYDDPNVAHDNFPELPDLIRLAIIPKVFL